MKKRSKWLAALCLIMAACLFVPAVLPEETRLAIVAEAASKIKLKLNIAGKLKIRITRRWKNPFW